MEYRYYIVVSIDDGKVTKWWSGDKLEGSMGLYPFIEYLKKNMKQLKNPHLLDNFELWKIKEDIFYKYNLLEWYERRREEEVKDDC